MNVNVKNPTKPYSAPPYVQEKTDKELVHFSWSIIKNLKHLYEAQKIWCVWDYGKRGGHTLNHIGLRGQRLPHGQKQDCLGVAGATLRSKTC